MKVPALAYPGPPTIVGSTALSFPQMRMECQTGTRLCKAAAPFPYPWLDRQTCSTDNEVAVFLPLTCRDETDHGPRIAHR